MRLVDADDAVNCFEELKPKGSSLDVRYAYGVSVGLEMAKHVTMSELPTVDAVPVVRCKDCTHWSGRKYNVHINGFLPWCGFSALQREADDFCSYGRRRGGDREKAD